MKKRKERKDDEYETLNLQIYARENIDDVGLVSARDLSILKKTLIKKK